MSSGKTALGLDANVGALVCYLNICLPIGLIYSIIVIVTDKTNKLTRFHAFQSLFASLLGIVIGIGGQIIGLVGAVVDSQLGFPLLSLGVGLIMIVVGLGLLVCVIIAAVQGFSGKIFRIPVIGGFADQFSN